MLDQIVHHLRSHDVPFRLYSYPAPEPLPEVAHPVPRGGLRVDTRVLFVAGRATVAVMPRGATPNFPSLLRELGVVVTDGAPSDLPPPYSRAPEPLPPLGGAMGVPTLVDQRVTTAAVLVFTVFSLNDFMEVDYDDFARLETPSVASFAIGGELPEGETEQKVA